MDLDFTHADEVRSFIVHVETDERGFGDNGILRERWVFDAVQAEATLFLLSREIH